MQLHGDLFVWVSSASGQKSLPSLLDCLQLAVYEISGISNLG